MDGSAGVAKPLKLTRVRGAAKLVAGIWGTVSMSYVDRSSTRQYSFAAIAPLGAGYIMSRFIGAVAWIPAIADGTSFVLLKKVVDRNVAVIATMAAIIAQTVWFLVGAIFVPGQAPNVALDLIVNLILLAAIFFRPGYVSAGIAILWNVLGIGVIGYDLANAPEAAGNALVSVEQRALVAHIILRAIIVAAAAMICVYKANPDLLPDEDDDENQEPVAEY